MIALLQRVSEARVVVAGATTVFAELQDAMDLAYLTGQRPADVLKASTNDLNNGDLLVGQGKSPAWTLHPGDDKEGLPQGWRSRQPDKMTWGYRTPLKSYRTLIKFQP